MSVLGSEVFTSLAIYRTDVWKTRSGCVALRNVRSDEAMRASPPLEARSEETESG